MPFTVVSTIIALIAYLYFGTMVGRARAKYGIKAPATTGSVDFERVFRVHQNTLEHLVVFLPSLWMFAVYVSDLYAGALGIVWTIGRVIYAQSYYTDAAKRGPGYAISLAAVLALMLGALVGVFLPH